MKPTVFIPEPIAASGMRLLEPKCACIAPWREASVSTDEGIHGADAVIVRLFEVRAENIEQCKHLKVIGKHGVGVDNIDCDAATAHRIPIVYTPAANANAVAEHTMTLILALSKCIVAGWNAVIQDRFCDHHLQAVEVRGKTLAILGLGRVGRIVAQMAADGLGMTVRAYDPLIIKAQYDGPATLVDSLEALLAEADFLTLHTPLTAQTQHLINKRTLDLLKPGCRIINTSRGGVIDEAALVVALKAGKLAGAALDVYETEPLPISHALCQLPNVLLTPHMASSTTESLDRMAQDVAEGVLDVLEKRRPRYVVNPQVM